MFESQYGIIKDSQELVRFLGDLNGDFIFELCAIEDATGSISVVRRTDILFVTVEEAREFDIVTYEILQDSYYSEGE